MTDWTRREGLTRALGSSCPLVIKGSGAEPSSYPEDQLELLGAKNGVSNRPRPVMRWDWRIPHFPIFLYHRMSYSALLPIATLRAPAGSGRAAP